MTDRDHDDHDPRFDAMLRALGPDVPEPALDDAARARMVETLDGVGALRVGSRGGAWFAVSAGALAAVLGLACLLLWVNLDRTRDRLTQSRWETDEVLQLLVSARRTQPSIAAPDDLAGLHASDLVLITFHHDLCPIARITSPGFRTLAREHDGDAARFISFDVTGDHRAEAGAEINALDLRFALLGPLGAETGVVKVVDTAHQRVLSSAPGRQGLEQAAALLARVGTG